MDATDAQSNFADSSHTDAQREKPTEVSRVVGFGCFGWVGTKVDELCGGDECVEVDWVNWVDWVD